MQPAARPDVDAIFGIPPTVAIEQRTSRGGRKSTVATLTEIYHFLRLLYVKLGVQYCPGLPRAHRAAIRRCDRGAVAQGLPRQKITLLAPLIVARKGLYTALAKWARSKGFRELRVDGAMLPTAKWPRLDRFVEHNIELPVATLEVSATDENRAARGARSLRSSTAAAWCTSHSAIERHGAAGAPAVFSTKRACPNCGTGFPELDPRLFSFNSRHGWCKSCFGTGLALPEFDAEQSGEEAQWRDPGDGAEAARGLRRMRRRAPQCGGAQCAVSRPLDRRAHGPCRSTNSPLPSPSSS